MAHTQRTPCTRTAHQRSLLFRLALEKGPAGKCWHAVGDGGIPFREIAEAIGDRIVRRRPLSPTETV